MKTKPLQQAVLKGADHYPRETNILMKQTFFTLLLFCSLGFFSCRKSSVDLTIKQSDQQQIQNYIAAHGLTGMIRDTSGGDTTGMYYQIISQGSGPAFNYYDKIYFVYSLRTFDGTYVSADTIANHYFDFVGHIQSPNNLPLGLQTAVHNILKYPGATMRLLIPSHLAYGLNGSGSGSSQVANNRIKGNECLDYFVHCVDTGKVAAYDDMVIANYIKANSLTGYSRTADGLYYSVLTPGTSTDPITTASSITCTYTGQLLNATIFDGSHNGTNTATLSIGDFATPGNVEGLVNYATAGTKISLIMPSNLGYGSYTTVGPAYSIMRFTWQILTVTP